MIRVRVVLCVLFFVAVHHAQRKKAEKEIDDDELDADIDSMETDTEDQTKESKNETQNEEKAVTQGPQVTLDEVKALKEGMEKVFGKNWTASDVKEAFDISGDYEDGDLDDVDLLVGIDGVESLIPMGRIKVK